VGPVLSLGLTRCRPSNCRDCGACSGLQPSSFSSFERPDTTQATDANRFALVSEGEAAPELTPEEAEAAAAAADAAEKARTKRREQIKKKLREDKKKAKEEEKKKRIEETKVGGAQWDRAGGVGQAAGRKQVLAG
jgi:hypothetical protein